MDKILVIAGHGMRKNGTYDPGAVGVVGGEHKYMVEKLFPAMKNYADGRFIFYTKRNVYSHGDIVALANSFGKGTKVVEVHYDGLDGKASGGHVIIHSTFSPDAMDLRIRDAIKEMVGLRASHKGHIGISGRNNLANVNRTAKGGINYRLIELGFGDNAKDAKVLLGQVDTYAEKLVEAIQGSAVEKVPSPSPTKSSAPTTPKPPAPTAKPSSGGSVVDYMNSMKMNSSYSNRARLAKIHGIAEYQGSGPQNIRLLNAIKGGGKAKPAPVKPKHTLESVAQEIAKGTGGWGTGTTRQQRVRAVGLNPTTVQNRVNAILGVKVARPTASKGPNLSAIVRQVLKGVDDKGRKVPTGRSNRAKHFGISMADMDKVQTDVNKQLR